MISTQLAKIMACVTFGENWTRGIEMNQSYFERAKHWIETAEDVDIENLESTLNRFIGEHKKSELAQDKTTVDLGDLTKTIEFLKGELLSLAGVDRLPDPIGALPDTPVTATSNDVEYKYDPSPLIDPSEPVVAILSDDQRRSALAIIKKMPGVMSAEALVQHKRRA